MYSSADSKRFSKSRKKGSQGNTPSDPWLSISGSRSEDGSIEIESGAEEELRFPVHRFASSLTYLRLQGNKLTNIPPDICELQSLVDLDLSQ